MLLELLKEDNIQTGIEASDWKDAGRKAGKPLVKRGSVQPEYIEAMIKNVEEMGPYIVLAPGLALFHGRPEDGVNEISLSMATLKEGVYFGAEENDPVEIVFVLGATDKDSHLELLAQLSRVLQDQQAVEAIKDARQPRDILSIIGDKINKE